MAKKFGKFLLCTAALGTAAAAAYYYIRKKDTETSMFQDDDDDYDDFSDDLDDDTDVTSRNYVPLNVEGQNTSEDTSTEEKDADFTPLEQVAQTAEKLEETVEDFFDEDDSSDEEPPIKDNEDN